MASIVNFHEWRFQTLFSWVTFSSTFAKDNGEEKKFSDFYVTVEFDVNQS